VDFSVLKDKIGGWVDKNWDHTMILYKDDEKTIDLVKAAPHFKDIFVLEKNPTAENLAYYLLWKVCPQLLQGLNIIVNKVVFWETENCTAEQTLDSESSEVRKLYNL
jgi:6-pyruvoyltetrahydropterin/6-carboxytetrahydropterin synthase